MKSRLLFIILLCLVSFLQAGYMDTDNYYVLEDQELAAWNGSVAADVTLNVVLDTWSSSNMNNTTSQWWMQFNPTNDALLPNVMTGIDIKGWKMTVTNIGTAQFSIILGASTPFNGWWQTGTGVGVEPGETKTVTIDITDTSGIPNQKDCTNLLIIFQSGSKMDFKFKVLSAHNYAYDPSPFHNTEVDPTVLTELSWKNIEGITANDVYFGTAEPNPADPNYDEWTEVLPLVKTILDPAAIQTLALSELPPLQDNTVYHWVVDSYRGTVPPVEPNFPGQHWQFTAYINQAPTVSLGDDQVVWLGQDGTPGQVDVTLTPVVNDDDRPVAQAELTYSWAKANNSNRIDNLVFPLPDKPSLTLPFTLPGVYDIKLDVNDTKLIGTDTVRITVGTSACDAARRLPGAPWFNGADLDQDCQVEMTDLTMLASNWLNCADFITNCQ